MKSKTRKVPPVVRLDWREAEPGYWAARVGACTLVVRIVEGQCYGWVIVRAMQTFHNNRGVQAGLARAERNLERRLKTALRAFTQIPDPAPGRNALDTAGGTVIG